MLRNSVYNTHKPKISFAKGLRKSQTPGEKVMWKKLRSKRFHNLKFRRQVTIGPYIVDFLCFEKKLVIEIDGYTHFESDSKEHDDKRDKYLNNEGFYVLHILNGLAVDDGDIALEKIALFLNSYTD